MDFFRIRFTVLSVDLIIDTEEQQISQVKVQTTQVQF